MKDQIISVAINIGGGLIAAFIYDWMRGRQQPRQMPVPASPHDVAEGRSPTRRRDGLTPPGAEERPAGASAGGGVLKALLVVVLLAAAGFAAAVVLHRLGVGAARPGLDALVRQGAVIGLSMLVFVWLLGRLHRR